MTVKKILMVAGEASADRHAACVIKALRTIEPGIRVFGMGGPWMASSGMECTFSMDELSVMGITDVIPKIRKIMKVYSGIKRLIEDRRPSLFIPVDLPDFNTRLALHAKDKGIPVLYYIAPQAWAWRRYRARTIGRFTDGLAVIFPFEEGFFTSYGVNARYVGHPFMEETGISWKASWPPKRIGIIPGSRYHEIALLLPVMMAAKRRIEEKYPDLSWHLGVAPGLDAGIIRAQVDENVLLVKGLPEVDLAMVKSGTSSLEMALRGVPEIICYRTSFLNYLLARIFVSVEHIGMPNIIAGKTIAPELIQRHLTAEDLARTLRVYLEDRALYDATRLSYDRMKESLGTMKASLGVARWAEELMERT